MEIKLAMIKTKKTPLILHRHVSPVGEIELGSVGEFLVMCDWTIEPRHSRVTGSICKALDCEVEYGDSPVIRRAISQLDEYFKGQRKDFKVPTLLCGTEFRKRVWNALSHIPYGNTTSYMDIAKAIDAPKAIRAVGTSIGANPISIIIPCHRVIGSNGSLTGYAGGIAAKKALLDLELSNKLILK